ncbi:hypothetical protein WDU94_011792 [Cyamophila willieti]
MANHINSAHKDVNNIERKSTKRCLECPHCSKKYTRAGMTYHINYAHKDVNNIERKSTKRCLECPHCSKKYTRAGMTKHIKYGHKDVYKIERKTKGSLEACPHCSKKYTRQGMANHINAAHKDVYKIERKTIKGSLELCPHCSKKYTRAGMANHINSAHKDVNKIERKSTKKCLECPHCSVNNIERKSTKRCLECPHCSVNNIERKSTKRCLECPHCSERYHKHFPTLPLSEDDSDDEFKGASPPSIMLPDEPLTISNPAPLSPIPTLSPQHSPSPIPSPTPSTASQYKKPSQGSPASKVNTPSSPCPQDMSQSSSEEVESESSGSESDSSSDTPAPSHPPPQPTPAPAPAVKEELPTWNLKNFITPSTQTSQDVESKEQDKECDEDSSDAKCSKPPVLIPHAQLLSSMSDSDHEPPAPPVKRSIGRPKRPKRPITNHSEDEAFVRRHAISPRLTAHAEPKIRRKPAPSPSPPAHPSKVDIPGKKKRGRKRLSKPPESGSDTEDERERPRKKLEPRKRPGRPSLSKPRPRLTMSDSEEEDSWRALTKRHKSESESSEAPAPVKPSYRSSSEDSVRIETSPPKLHVATPKLSYGESNIPKIDVENVPKQDNKKKETLLKLWGSKGAGKGGKDKGGKGKGGGMIIVEQRSPAVSERIPSPVDMKATVEPPPPPLQYTPTGRPILMCSISLSKLSHIPSKSRSEEMRIKTELADTRQKEKTKKPPIVNTTSDNKEKDRDRKNKHKKPGSGTNSVSSSSSKRKRRISVESISSVEDGLLVKAENGDSHDSMPPLILPCHVPPLMSPGAGTTCVITPPPPELRKQVLTRGESCDNSPSSATGETEEEDWKTAHSCKRPLSN